MSERDDHTEGIRGSELAEDAGSAAARPEADDLAAGGVRGDGLADGAGGSGHPAPDPDEAAADGIRGDGLAEDA